MSVRIDRVVPPVVTSTTSSSPPTPAASVATSVVEAAVVTASGVPAFTSASRSPPGPAPGFGGAGARATLARTGRVDDDAIHAGRAALQVRAENAALGLVGDALREKEASLKADAHAFFRGTPALFVSDMLGPHAALLALQPTPAPTTAVLVDFHLGNLGTFRGPRGVLWGPNDYDQAGRGRPELDLLRCATSMTLVARARGIDADDTRKAIKKLVRHYADEVEHLARSRRPSPPALGKKAVEGCLDDLIATASRQVRTDGVRRFVDGNRLRHADDVVPATSGEVAAVTAALGSTFADAGTLQVHDVAVRLHAGGSSRGLPRFLALAEIDGAQVLLELKRAPPAPLAAPAPFDAAAVVGLQRAMSGSLMSDRTRAAVVAGSSFLVREVEPEKATLDLRALQKDDLKDVAEAAGTVLARIHGADRDTARDLKAWLGDDVDGVVERLQRHAARAADLVAAEHAAFCR